ncbi:MAG: DEAD/DEAH box helicase, partial [Thermofilum sp.]|nr:DEAD/DEAH box helicase [Thermofilum sp.]
FFKKFKEWYKNMNVDFRFYDFQVEGIKAILEEAKNALQQEGKRGVVLEARTGSGKTEAFLIASILVILAYKLALIAINNDKKKKVENKDETYAKIKVELPKPVLDFAKALIEYAEGKIIKKPRAPPEVASKEVLEKVVIAIKRLGYNPAEIVKKVKLRVERSPLIVIAYPRRALATDQIKRLIRYVYIFNNTLSELKPELKEKIPPYLVDYLKINISMNYTEVRYVEELLRELRQYVQIKDGKGQIENWYTIDLKRYGIRLYACIENDNVVVQLPYVFSPDGSTFLLAKIPLNIIMDNHSYDLICNNLKTLYWRRLTKDKKEVKEEEIDFIRAFKELVYEDPGDIHVTLFETLRRDLLNHRAKQIFGVEGGIGPLIFVIDEIHLYSGVYGARVAYLLDRVLSRVRLQTEKKRGAVFVCLSATIPGGEDFVRRFLGAGSVRSGIKPRRTIPMGGEYIYVVVPALGVEHLSVSIQSVMALHTNMPAYPFKGGRRKKTLVFADSLDVVYRLRVDLRDAVCEKRLQDLRNARSVRFYDTLTDLNDKKEDVEKALKLLSGLEKLNSWREGELWWPYSLEDGGRALGLAIYTGREKEEIVDADLVVTDSALEVGVDYDDVAVIYQHGAPLSFAALIQRAGRGGRLMKDNPLVRAAIAVMLSPYLPTQAAMLELLLRSGGSLQSLLERERLPLAVENSAVIEQSIVEAILDCLTVKDYQRDVSKGSREVDQRAQDFEKLLAKILREKELEIKDYLKETFKDRLGLDVERRIDEVLSELKGELPSAGEDRW